MKNDGFNVIFKIRNREKLHLAHLVLTSCRDRIAQMANTSVFEMLGSKEGHKSGFVRYVYNESILEANRYLVMDKRNHQEFVFAVVDDDGNPERWFMSEYSGCVNMKTATVFEMMWSEKLQTKFVVQTDDGVDVLWELENGSKVWSTIYHYDDFCKMFTPTRKRTFRSVEDVPIYSRNTKVELLRFWVRQIRRANEESHDHIPLDDDRYTLDSIISQVKNVLDGSVHPEEQYERIREIVRNSDFVSVENQFRFFP